MCSPQVFLSLCSLIGLTLSYPVPLANPFHLKCWVPLHLDHSQSKAHLRNSSQHHPARLVSPTSHLPEGHLWFIWSQNNVLISAILQRTICFQCHWHLGREKHINVSKTENQIQMQTNQSIKIKMKTRETGRYTSI